MVAFIKRLLKICFIVFIGFLVFVICLKYYGYYRDNERYKLELGFHATRDWKWQNDRVGTVQIAHDKWRNQTLLRKVMLDENYEVIVGLWDNNNIHATAIFYTPCEPLKVIVTDQKFYSGTPKKLICNTAGDGVMHRVMWNRDVEKKYPDLRWEDNVGGFTVNVDMSYWDFKPLDQELTLNGVKPWEYYRRMEPIDVLKK